MWRRGTAPRERCIRGGRGATVRRIVEPLLEVLLEFVLQVVVEVLAEVGLRRVWQFVVARPTLAVIGYAGFGALGGWLSLLVFPRVWVSSELLRWVNLVVTPIAVGFVMAALGRWRQRHAQRTIRLDRFACGYVFALALAAVRFVFGA